jgi:LuxR family transcriptional regulator, maltose regulon positive regulatory protein
VNRAFAGQDRPSALSGLADEPLLATKLMVPQLPEWFVTRPRLLGLLTEGAQGPLTLLAAPAGTGKTMLLGSWARSGRHPGAVAWLTLDADDNDRARFWAYVLAGLRASDKVPPDGAVAALAPPEPGMGEGFLPVLVNGLGELPGPVVLVLDDVHELTDAPVLADLEFLVQHAPPQLRLVLASRADPALRLSRLRVAGALTEVRAAELAFTHAEAAELLTALGTALSDAEVAALWTRTEGWAAGLRLACLSLQHHPDPSGFVTAFSGDDRAVAAYLIGEVLDRQPADLREFLLHTSLANRLTGGLADALTGRQDGVARLRELERTNAFVVPLDPNRTAYRYHQLFAELLRAELRQQYPDEVAELHRRAARWHAADGVTADAIRHALAAADWDYARDLLVQRASVLAATPTILRELLARLPPDLVHRDPELAAIAAISRVLDGNLEAADRYRRLAEANAAAVPEDRRAWFAAVLAETRLYPARLLSDLDGVRAAAQELLELAPLMQGGSPWAWDAAHLQMYALNELGWAAFWSGDLEAGAQLLEQGLQVVVGRPLLPSEEVMRHDGLSLRALVAAASGRLQAAMAGGQEAVGLGERLGWPLTTFGAHLALAWATYHQGDLAAAGRHLDRASLASPEPTAITAVALLRSRLLASQGQPAAGLAALRQGVAAAQHQGRWQPPGFLAELVRLGEAGLLVATGDTTAARAVLAQADDPRASAEVAVVVARLQQAQGDPASAVATLAAHLDGGTALSHQVVALEAQLLQAVLQAELGAREEAAHALEAALALATPEGNRQVFIDGGPAMRSLLARQLELGTKHPALVADLLGRVATPAAHGGIAASPLVDPLSDREQTVLRYLASVLTTTEIAAELYVSPNTVKTHVKSIYRKLGAVRRRDAVNQARQLGLL